MKNSIFEQKQYHNGNMYNVLKVNIKIGRGKMENRHRTNRQNIVWGVFTMAFLVQKKDMGRRPLVINGNVSTARAWTVARGFRWVQVIRAVDDWCATTVMVTTVRTIRNRKWPAKSRAAGTGNRRYLVSASLIFQIAPLGVSRLPSPPFDT